MVKGGTLDCSCMRASRKLVKSAVKDAQGGFGSFTLKALEELEDAELKASDSLRDASSLIIQCN